MNLKAEPITHALSSTATTTHDVAVIIVNYHGGMLLHRCLAAVQAQTLRPRRVVVVDNGSDDGLTAIREEFPWVEILEPGVNLGFAAANNQAVACVGDVYWVALLNPDAFPEPHWLQYCVAFAQQHPEHGSIGCRLLNAEQPDMLDGTGDCMHVMGWPWRRDHGFPLALGHLDDGEILSPCAAAALYRREVYQALGGLDENFFCYLEDVDLGLRLQLAGYSCGYCAQAVVHHAGSAITGRRSDFTIYYSQRNLLWNYVKNLPAGLFWRYLPWHLLFHLLGVVSFSLKGQMRVVLRAKWDALRGLATVWRQRQAIQAQRRISAASLLARLERGWPRPPRYRGSPKE